MKSVGKQGRGLTQRQPLSPVECGILIQRLIDEENEDKYQIAERLDLGRPRDGTDIYKKRDTTQLDHFLSLLKVSEKSRDFAGWGWEGLPKIPFTTIFILSAFSHDEQDKVLQAALKGEKKSEIQKKDAEKLRKWRIENPNLTIDEGIEKILKLKSPTIITHVIVCYIQDKLKNFIKINPENQKTILQIFENKISGKFYDLEITEKLLTLSMDEEAYKTFYDQQFKKDISFTEFVNTLLEDEIA